MQIEKQLNIDYVNVQDLLGFNDVNIKPIEEKYVSTLVFRGDKAIIKGSSEEVSDIEKILKEMIYVLNTKGDLKVKDVLTIIDLVSSSSVKIENKDYDNIVLYSKKDVIKAKTPTQIEYFESVAKNDICFAIGPAGTGKTYLAVAFAVAALKKGIVQRIVLTRPAVEAGESLGFLPGDFRDKIDPYLRPLYDALQDMLPKEQLKNYLEKGTVEIAPLAFMRGRTINNAYVILDEAQNSTPMQMKMFLTRLGPNSKSIITGDITQIDLPRKSDSGLVQVKDILQNIDGVGFVFFNKGDVVRHKLVKDIINAYDNFSENS
jgi:phosphate starvation-inducible PhoH-like protein